MAAPSTLRHRPEPPAQDRSTVDRVWSIGPLAFVPHFVALVATLTCYLVWRGDGGLLALSAISVAFACWRAVHSGGAFITPSGIFFMASGVFVGLAGYYLVTVDTDLPIDTLRFAAVIALALTIVVAIFVEMMTISMRLSWPVEVDTTPVQPPTHFALKGALMVLMSFLPIVAALGPIAHAVGVGGLFMLVLWAAARRLNLTWYGDVLVVALCVVLPLMWAQLVFTGGGRLMVAGVGISAFCGWNLFNPKRLQKILVILTIPLFLWASGHSRLNESDTSASSVVGSGAGLASVYGPLETFGRVIGASTPEETQRVMPRWGATFVNTATMPVPRSIWDDKPKGFGAELTEVYEPKLVKSDHSMAALMHAEWYANFGYVGLALMVPGIGAFLALLDRRHSRLAGSGMRSHRHWWQAAVLVCCASSLADLFWVGTFTYFARGGFAALIVALVGRLSLSRQEPRGTAAFVPIEPAPVGA